MRIANKIKFQVYFYQLFFQITILVTLVVLFLSVFLYVNYKSYYLKMLYHSSEELMTQTIRSSAEINSNIKTISLSLFKNVSASQLMYSGSLSILDTLGNMKSIELSISSLPYIYSAYVYNGRTDMYYIIGPNNYIRQNSFFDQEIVRTLKNAKTPPLTPIPRRIAVGYDTPGKTADVYTYIIPDYIDGKTLNGALVINVRMDKIFNSFESSAYGKTNMILDQNGTVIAHDDESDYLKNFSDVPYVKQILTSSRPSGYFETEVNGVHSLVTYALDGERNWYYLSVTPYRYISNVINKLQNITLLISGIMLAVCLFATLLLSQHLYVPILRLRRKASHSPVQNSTNASDHDEFHFISIQFDNLLSFKNSNIGSIAHEYVKSFILQKKANPHDIHRFFKEYNIPLNPEERIAMVMFQIDNRADFTRYNSNDRSLFLYALSNMANQIFALYQPCYSVECSPDHVITVFRADIDDPMNGSFHKNAVESVKKVQEACANYLPFTVSAYISPAGNSFRNADSLYESVLEISTYRFVHGHGCILTEGDIDKARNAHLSINHAKMTDLTDAVKAAKPEEMKRHYDSIMDEMIRSNFNSIMVSLSLISASIFNTIHAIENNGTVNFELDFSAFDKKIKSIETIDRMHAEFIALFQHIADKITKNKQEKTDMITPLAMQYILNNITDPFLSPNSVAEKLKISPAYLRKLFRENTSLSVTEYIMEQKMRKAMEWMLQSDMPINNIIEKVGWENKKYFYTVFKKYTGVTPSEYRLKASVRDII